MSSQLRNIWRSIPLHKFHQGSTLSIRTSPRLRQQLRTPLAIVIAPEWRDDAHLALSQTLPPLPNDDRHSDVGSEAVMNVTYRDDDHPVHVDVSIDLAHDDVVIKDARPKTSTTTNSTTTSRHPHLTLTARIPEKTNLSCHSITGGITLTSKLESDDLAHLDCDGDIVVDSKIRARTLVLRSRRGTIAVRKQLEGDVVSLAARRRLRCRLLHGRDVSVTVGGGVDDGDEGREGGGWKKERAWDDDDDDALALVDIGSLYTSKSGTAAIDVVGSGYDGRCVRVKSHHGHASITTHYSPTTITTTPPQFPPSSTKHDKRPPAVVELGGVNGSCDVTVVVTSSSSPSIPSSFVAARVHVDSLASDGVSVISCRKGDVELTVDRKVETDVRLLSLPEEEEEDEEEKKEEEEEDMTSFCDRVLTMEDERDITDALLRYGKGKISVDKKGGDIDILTEAFQPMRQHDDDESHENGSNHTPNGISYATGRLVNNSHEPPSRFDVSVKGKIDIDGARALALRGFGGGGGGGPNDDSDDMAFPLVAAGTVGGRVSLETVSWFGAIARRYGMMEDGKGMVDVGRQAGRRGRWDK